MNEYTTNLRKNILKKDCRNVLDDLVNADVDDTYTGEYFGVVVNNNDPTKKGRCRIRVYNLFPSTIPDNDLPWAIPEFSYMGGTKGSFIVPPVNTKVKVYFDRDDVYCPIYNAKSFSQNELPNGILTNYPDTMIIYSTDQGEYFSVNRITKETKLHNASGIDIKMINGKIAIGTAQVEVLDILSNLIELIYTSIVPTPMGPQQLSNTVGGAASLIGILKQRLDTIKGTL